MTLLRRVLVLAALAALLPASAQAAQPGLNILHGYDLGSLDDTATLSDTGAKWARHFVNWNELEPGAKGNRQNGRIAEYTETFRREAAAGVKPMVVVTRSPQWASGSADPDTPPANPQDYADFVRHLARTWKGKVGVYEIWNEQDETQFWKGAPDAARYVNLLRPAYAAIKAEDPTAKVAFGPTTGNNYAYLEAAYAAGAQGSFDAVSVHTDTACLDRSPYNYYRENGRIAQFTFLGYREVRATMLASGDDKPIYMSELGWSSTQLTCSRGMWAGKKPAGVSEADQARFLAEAFHCLQEDPYVELALWFNNIDIAAAEGELNRYGLKRSDGSLKPAYAAFKSFALSGDRLTGPCGDFVKPQIAVKSPAPGRRVFDRLVVAASTPDRDVARMSFYVDGKEVENFTPKAPALVRDYAKEPLLRDWQGVRKLPFGAHMLRITAVDTSGNESAVEIPFERVDPRALPPRKTLFHKLALRGKARARTFSGRLASPGLDFAIPGKVKVEWQNRRKGRWKKIHGGVKNANETFRFKQRLRFKGRWRVRAVYAGAKPYKRAATPWKPFRVR